MGQKLDAQQKEFLRRHPKVAGVTDEHVLLRSGEVVDPSEFPIGNTRCFLIRKLLHCGCDGRGHVGGTHIAVEVFGGWTVLGNIYIREPNKAPEYCPNGRWITEEVVTENNQGAFESMVAFVR